MTFKTDDRVFETSITTGTGTYTLDGAQVGFTTFSGMGANNLCPYFATDDTNWEVGIGTVLTGPNRLERTTILRSSNADAAVNWGAGTRKIRCGLPAAMAIPRTLSKSVAGAANVTLSQDEQRRDILILTGALTGNINVIVDATPWKWTVFNNTTGAYTLTLKTTAGTGKAITQGKRALLECDGTNVVSQVGHINGDLEVTGALKVTGNVTAPGTPAFQARAASGTNLTGDGTAYPLVYDAEFFDQGNNFAGNVFTAPVGGRYRLSCSVQTYALNANHNIQLWSIVTSNRSYPYQEVYTAGANPLSSKVFVHTVLADMDAGDTASVSITISGGTKTVSLGVNNSYFFGSLEA